SRRGRRAAPRDARARDQGRPRDRPLSGRRARFPLRPAAVLPGGRGEGRLETHARLGQATSRAVAAMYYTLSVEKDVMIPTRGGGAVCTNVLRPAEAGEFHVIMTLGPYPQDLPFEVW